eukprot:6477724-Amphidinium_carterae.1
MILSFVVSAMYSSLLLTDSHMVTWEAKFLHEFSSQGSLHIFKLRLGDFVQILQSIPSLFGAIVRECVCCTQAAFTVPVVSWFAHVWSISTLLYWQGRKQRDSEHNRSRAFNSFQFPRGGASLSHIDKCCNVQLG